MKKSFKTVLAIAIIAAATAGAFHYWDSWNQKGNMDAISIGAIPYDKNALIYIADDQKFFAANGLHVTLQDFVTGVAAVEAMMAGQVDIGAASEFVVVGRSLNHQEEQFRIIASIAKTHDDHVFGRTDRGINHVSDFQGKRIAVKRQTAAEFYLGRFLDRHGMNIGQVEIVDLNPEQSMEAFTAGDLDGIVIWQPYAYQISSQLADKTVSWSAQSGQLMYWNLAAPNAWIEAHPEQINRFLQALVDAESFLARHPAEARAIVQKRLGYDDATITAIWPETQYSVSLDQALIVAMEDEARWVIANNLTSQTQVPDFLEYVDLKSLSSMKPEAVNIIR